MSNSQHRAREGLPGLRFPKNEKPPKRPVHSAELLIPRHPWTVSSSAGPESRRRQCRREPAPNCSDQRIRSSSRVRIRRHQRRKASGFVSLEPPPARISDPPEGLTWMFPLLAFLLQRINPFCGAPSLTDAHKNGGPSGQTESTLGCTPGCIRRFGFERRLARAGPGHAFGRAVAFAKTPAI